jgi:hypothetical protein
LAPPIDQKIEPPPNNINGLADLLVRGAKGRAIKPERAIR